MNERIKVASLRRTYASLEEVCNYLMNLVYLIKTMRRMISG